MANKLEVHIRVNSAIKNGIWNSENNKLSRYYKNKEIIYENFKNILYKETNKEVYEKCLKSVVLENRNFTVFAYGQTGSGKTYTMLGDNDGILIYCLSEILTRHIITVSYIEIYNEKIYDLFSNTELQVYTIDNKATIKNLQRQQISDINEANEFLKKCELNRKYGSTEYNTRSSRSHTIFQIVYNYENREIVCNLIDLAGSEKACKNTNRRTEGAYINKSLLALCTVINNLKNKKYFGFRDSKLTRLLQSSLDGNTNIVSICTISPSADCVDESISTLNFAARLMDIDLKKVEVIANKKPDTCLGISDISIHKINLKPGFYQKQFIEMEKLKQENKNLMKDKYKQTDKSVSSNKELLHLARISIDADDIITKEDKIMCELNNSTNDKQLNIKGICCVDKESLEQMNDESDDFIIDSANQRPFIDEHTEMLIERNKLENIKTRQSAETASVIDFVDILNKHNRENNNNRMYKQKNRMNEEIKLLYDRIERLEDLINRYQRRSPDDKLSEIFKIEKRLFEIRMKKIKRKNENFDFGC